MLCVLFELYCTHSYSETLSSAFTVQCVLQEKMRKVEESRAAAAAARETARKEREAKQAAELARKKEEEREEVCCIFAMETLHIPIYLMLA